MQEKLNNIVILSKKLVLASLENLPDDIIQDFLYFFTFSFVLIFDFQYIRAYIFNFS